MDYGFNLLGLLISSHQNTRDQVSRYLFELQQSHINNGASFPFRVWRDGRYETKAEAIARAERQLAAEDEALAAYKDVLARALDPDNQI
jgi:hypothetical protein